MARNKSKRKKKVNPFRQAISPKRYIKEHARKMPIHACLISDDWREKLFSPIIVVRQKKTGNFIFGSYVVDMQCLGVKDSLYQPDMDHSEYKEMLEVYEHQMGLNMVEIDPVLCFNIIYAAVDFAEDCGFQPHKSFATSQYILDDVEEIAYMEVPPGADSKPHFIAGPYDDVDKVLRTLNKALGEGNYDYTYPLDEFGDLSASLLSEEELARFFDRNAIDRKFASFDDEDDDINLELQLTIAEFILVEGKGNIDTVKTMYHNEDYGFVDKVLETMTDKRNQFAPDEATEEDLAYMEDRITWMTEKIIEHGGPQFLWTKDYQPSFTLPTLAELQTMSAQERDQYEQKRLFYLTERDQEAYLLRKVFFILSDNYSAEQLQDPAMEEQLIQNYLKELQDTVFTKQLEEDTEEYLRSLAIEALEVIRLGLK